MALNGKKWLEWLDMAGKGWALIFIKASWHGAVFLFSFFEWGSVVPVSGLGSFPCWRTWAVEDMGSGVWAPAGMGSEGELSSWSCGPAWYAGLWKFAFLGRLGSGRCSCYRPLDGGALSGYWGWAPIPVGVFVLGTGWAPVFLSWGLLKVC